MITDNMRMIIALLISVVSFGELVKAQSAIKPAEALSDKEERIIPIAAYTTNGEQEYLKLAIQKGLDAGLTINEIKEVMVQLYAYAGFPRSLNALTTLEEVLEERKQRGIGDSIGSEASSLADDVSMREIGSEVLVKLVGTSEARGVRVTTPIIDTFLKEHLFGAIFNRDVLDFRSREIATIAALASLEGTDSQLASHLRVAKNIGLTNMQLHQLGFVLSVVIGWKEGQKVEQLMQELYDVRSTSKRELEFGVSMEKVMFPHREVTMVANIYYPKGFDETLSYPAIVVGHPNGGVKEQTAGLYAQKLAEQGFITLAFDAAYQGESGGKPRFLDDPAVRTEDYRAAADFITTLDVVDAARIGVLGICGGGGYAIHAAQTDHRFNAVATVSMVDGGDLRRNGMNGSLTATIQDRLEEVARQRSIEANGGPIRYNVFVPNSEEDIPANASRLYIEGYEYYRVTHKEPTAPNKYTFTSLDKLINFTALDHVELISPRPLLVIAGSNASTLYYSQQAYERANEPKELFTIDGATHIQLYWKPEYVSQAIEKLSYFYRNNL